MDLTLEREPTADGGTFGRLILARPSGLGDWVCDTLEDVIRQPASWRPGQPVAPWKVYGETAIPTGLYDLSLTWSGRFQRLLPQVHPVPGFQGIRIHAGNTVEDTDGCILVGLTRLTRRGRPMIARSREALELVLALFTTHPPPHTIRITAPVG